jgi:pyruvate dehydrogenase E1 component alpha subunit
MNAYDSSLGKEDMLRLFYSMLRIRLVEEEIAANYPEQEMRCPVHLSIGQEAVPAGVCANLNNEDYVLSSHRSHGYYLAKGGDLTAMISEIYGKAGGCTMGKGGSMHLFDQKVGFLGAIPIVGSAIPIAAGVAFGTLMKGGEKITVVFFGDGAIEEGVFHETLNFAALKKIPLLFICENNYYSVYSPLSVRQPSNREIVSIAQGHGIESYQGDGNNVLDVYHLTKKAINRIHHGEGPIFLELKTYRWLEHCGPYYDNDIGYRTKEEFLSWKERCPIDLFKRYLIQKNVIQSNVVEDMGKKIKTDIKNAFDKAKKDVFPDKSELNKNIYAK